MPCTEHSAFSSGLPLTRLAWLGLGLLTAALALGCTPQIGDKCTVSTNCSTTGDRLCDVTQPGGYCTKFNCEPGSCPEDSVCINFGTRLSPLQGCASSQANSPYKRSFCMANCSKDNDCREGYACLLAEDFGAVLAEHSSGQRVCAVPLSDATKTAYYDAGPDADPGMNSTEVCTGSDAGPASGGSSSSGGSGGSSSSGGSGGAAAGGAAGDGSATDGGASGDGGTGS